MVVGRNGWACWDLAQGSIPGSCTNWRLLVTIFHNLKSFFCFTGTRWDEPQNLWSAILCPCLKVVYVHVIKNLQLTSRRHFKKTHRAFLVFILSLKHVGLNNDLRKEIWIWSTTSQHVFVCLVCLKCCLYLFGAAWQSLDIQGLHLLGILWVSESFTSSSTCWENNTKSSNWKSEHLTSKSATSLKSAQSTRSSPW